MIEGEERWNVRYFRPTIRDHITKEWMEINMREMRIFEVNRGSVD